MASAVAALSSGSPGAQAAGALAAPADGATSSGTSFFRAQRVAVPHRGLSPDTVWPRGKSPDAVLSGSVSPAAASPRGLRINKFYGFQKQTATPSSIHSMLLAGFWSAKAV